MKSFTTLGNLDILIKFAGFLYTLNIVIVNYIIFHRTILKVLMYCGLPFFVIGQNQLEQNLDIFFKVWRITALLKLGSYYWGKNAHFRAHYKFRTATNQNHLNLKNWCAYFCNAPSSEKMKQRVLIFKTKQLRCLSAYTHFWDICITLTRMKMIPKVWRCRAHWILS